MLPGRRVRAADHGARTHAHALNRRERKNRLRRESSFFIGWTWKDGRTVGRTERRRKLRVSGGVLEKCGMSNEIGPGALPAVAAVV